MSDYVVVVRFTCIHCLCDLCCSTRLKFGVGLIHPKLYNNVNTFILMPMDKVGTEEGGEINTTWLMICTK